MHVNTQNTAAQRLYERAGFIEQKTCFAFYDTEQFDSKDAYEMRLYCAQTPNKLNTPITKGGLRALRYMDLKQKLKKYNIKAYGRKEDLVTAVFNYKKTKQNYHHNILHPTID